MRKTVWVASLGVLLGAGMALGADQYTVDPAHATVGFQVSHLVISKVRGSFTDYTASLTLDADGNLLGAAATIQTKSIDTGNEKRDEHLRSADFFDAATYPEITFKSSGVETRGGKKVLVGDLTIHGTTKQVAMPYQVLGPIKDPWGNTKIGFEASTTIDRTEYGLTWNNMLEAGGAVVGTDVELQINLEATKQ